MRKVPMRPKTFALLIPAAMIVLAMSFQSGVAAAKKEAPASRESMNRFLIRLIPAHPDAAASEEDKARIVMHFEYLKTLLADGKLVLAGISTDDSAAILLVEAADREEAERIMASDPAVSGKVYQGEVHPFKTVLARQDH
jgi:uncharacterized protein YciI